MLHIYFGGLKEECLGRLGFLAYSLLLVVFFITGGLAIGFGLGVADQLGGDDVQETQSELRDAFGVPFIVAIWAAGLTFLFADLNISAKRVRHIGLPGWPVMLAVSAVIVLLALFVSPKIGLGLSFLAWLALLFVPGGMAGRRFSGK